MKKIWIDTETTGTDPQTHDIWQVAGIIEANGKDREFNFKMRPFNMDAISKEALEVGGITMEKLASFTDARIVLAEFSELLSQYVSPYNKHDKFTLCGFNVGFDDEFLRAWWQKCGNKFYGSFFWWPPVDVGQLAHMALLDMGKRQTMKNFKLETVAEALDIHIVGTLHDAIIDARITREIAYKIMGM